MSLFTAFKAYLYPKVEALARRLLEATFAHPEVREVGEVLGPRFDEPLTERLQEALEEAGLEEFVAEAKEGVIRFGRKASKPRLKIRLWLKNRPDPDRRRVQPLEVGRLMEGALDPLDPWGSAEAFADRAAEAVQVVVEAAEAFVEEVSRAYRGEKGGRR